MDDYCINELDIIYCFERRVKLQKDTSFLCYKKTITNLKNMCYYLLKELPKSTQDKEEHLFLYITIGLSNQYKIS